MTDLDEELDASALEEELVDPDELRDPLPARARSPPPGDYQNNAVASHAQAGPPPSYSAGGSGMVGANGFVGKQEDDEDRVRPSEMPDEGLVIFS